MSEQPPPATRAPKVLGTLSIVFGALVAFWSPLSLLMRSFLHGMENVTKTLPVQPGMRDPAIDFGAAEAILDAQSGYMTFSALMFTAMSIALVVIGIGMVKRRRWARKAAIGWSALGLMILFAQAIAFFAWLQPHANAVRDAYYAAHNVPPPPMQAAGQAGGVIGAIIGWLVYGSYPTILLTVLGKRSAVDDFTT